MKRSVSVLALGLLTLLSTPGCPRRIPLPEDLRVDGTNELLARMQSAQTPVRSYSAEIRLTYFGPKGRVRGTASVAVMRPASLRYELQGPHGGVLEAFATNGSELQLMDLKASRFLHGPATRANLNQLLSLIPLGLSADEWVSLLFGEIQVPAMATLRYDDQLGRFVLIWTESDLTRRVEVDPESSRLVRATVEQGGTVLTTIEVAKRDDRGLPEELQLQAPQADIGVEVRVRDVAYDIDFEADVFVLDPPRNVVPEHLGTE